MNKRIEFLNKLHSTTKELEAEWRKLVEDENLYFDHGLDLGFHQIKSYIAFESLAWYQSWTRKEKDQLIFNVYHINGIAEPNETNY